MRKTVSIVCNGIDLPASADLLNDACPRRAAPAIDYIRL
jgi:hypothetical protein